MSAPPDIEFHPLSEIFPLIEGKDFDDLVADIRAHGVHEPIWLYQGKVLDGRNRYRASLAADVDCPLREYTGDDPAAFVVSLNLKRRHLNESQRAMVAAKLANMPQGARVDLRANLHEVSAAKAAEMLNVSERTVKSAKQVQEKAAPELKAAVEQGKVSVSAAADVATKSKEEQREIVARGEKGVREAAKSIRAEKKRAAPTSPDHAPTGSNADREEAFNLARGLKIALEGMAPILDSIVVGRTNQSIARFWRLLGPTPLRKELYPLLQESHGAFTALLHIYIEPLKRDVPSYWQQDNPQAEWDADEGGDNADADTTPPAVAVTKAPTSATAERPVRLSNGTSAAANAARSKTSYEKLEGQIEMPLDRPSTSATAESVQHEDHPSLPEFLDRRHEAPPTLQ
jgi:ParB-like chromosome segregation protein Spo0J